MIPTVTQALERLQQNPREAAQFDACSPPGTTRREAVVATLAAFAAKRAENEAMRAKLLAARQKIAALEAARKSQPASSMKTPPSLTVKATPQAATVTAAAYATQPLLMARAEFQKLSDTDKIRFSKSKGRLV
jgi:hypothetical protein